METPIPASIYWMAKQNTLACAQELLEALAELRLEAMHYRNTGKGQQFLNQSLDKAETVILKCQAIQN